MISARPKTFQIPCCLVLLSFLQYTDTVIHANSKSNLFYPYHRPVEPELKLNKVSLTQRGYIQFLRYFNEVPSLTEYTFCIWVRSNNLTYNHPLMSYSRHEDQRLIRVWISPGGSHINLEILEVPVFSLPVGFAENHWYHVCQSWSSFSGGWSLFLNGRLETSGYEPKLKASIIPGGGDIVVGQEYTDFDKGLDDGIEGDIFGFNFVLAPTSTFLKQPPPYLAHHNLLKRSYDKSNPTSKSKRAFFPDSTESSASEDDSDEDFLIASSKETRNSPTALNYLMTESDRQPKTFSMFHDFLNLFEPEVTLKTKPIVRRPERKPQQSIHHRIINDIHDLRKPLGLQLVELSFHCGIKKGAPLAGRGVLINWNLTPVRVFGGAIMKTVPAFC